MHSVGGDKLGDELGDELTSSQPAVRRSPALVPHESACVGWQWRRRWRAIEPCRCVQVQHEGCWKLSRTCFDTGHALFTLADRLWQSLGRGRLGGGEPLAVVLQLATTVAAARQANAATS